MWEEWQTYSQGKRSSFAKLAIGINFRIPGFPENLGACFLVSETLQL